MDINYNDFDCRTINNGSQCPHLSPWGVGLKSELARICTCKALNDVIFPVYHDHGKMTQELIKVEPLFNCPFMQKLRKEGKAPHVQLSINPQTKTNGN